MKRVEASDPDIGTVCPAVDGRAVAAERDMYSPGARSTVREVMERRQRSCLPNSSCGYAKVLGLPLRPPSAIRPGFILRPVVLMFVSPSNRTQASVVTGNGDGDVRGGVKGGVIF